MRKVQTFIGLTGIAAILMISLVIAPMYRSINTIKTLCNVMVNELEKPREVEYIPVQAKDIDEDDLDLLAHLIYAEAGCDWISDITLYAVGSVALNRVNSDLFPDTLREVVYQEGQYACTWDGNIEKEPSERCYRIAEELLRNGSYLPDDVIYQAQFKQGSGVYMFTDTMYFCHM